MMAGMAFRRSLIPLGAVLSLGAFVAAAPAQPRPVKQGSFGTAKASGPLLTRAELRACFEQQERIRDQNEAAAREREQFDREKADLVQRGAALKEQLDTLDRSSQEAVDRYNAQAADRDRRIDAFEARMPALDARVEALRAERAAFAKACENRRYDERDEVAIRKGR
jgi:chromosome segregation ATPase